MYYADTLTVAFFLIQVAFRKAARDKTLANNQRHKDINHSTQI